jgi:hypothetical protein
MIKYWYAHIMLVVIFFGCHPEPDNATLLDELVVSTNVDPEADFSSYSTYAIPTDTIGFISNTSRDTILTASRSSFPRPVLNAIRSGLDNRGYTSVSRDENPDLGVNVIVVNDYNVFQQIIYPGGAFGYPGNFYSGYYGYNSWYYYPYVNTYAYNTGVLIIEIVDLKNRTANNEVKVIWNVYLGDIYSTINLTDQSVIAIDQAFNQSPYIQKSGITE